MERRMEDEGGGLWAGDGEGHRLESTFLCHFISYLVLSLCSSIIVVQDFMINQILCGNSSLGPPLLWISAFPRYASDDSSLWTEVQNGRRCCFFLPR